MEQYVIDTHALLWYAAADNRIGSQAKATIERCEAGEIEIIVPAIVLVEAISTLRNPRKKLILDPILLLDFIDEHPKFKISVLDMRLARMYNQELEVLQSLHDDHDRLIALTSLLFGNISIITKAVDIGKIFKTTW